MRESKTKTPRVIFGSQLIHQGLISKPFSLAVEPSGSGDSFVVQSFVNSSGTLKTAEFRKRSWNGGIERVCDSEEARLMASESLW